MNEHDSQSESGARQRQWIESLVEGGRVDEVYLVWRKNKLVARNGRSYLALQVGDRTGRVEARAWDRADELDGRFGVHDLVRVRGQVVRFQDSLQIKVQDILPVESPEGPASSEEMGDFLPSSSHSVSQMWSELLDLVDGLSNVHLRWLLDGLLGDSDVATRFQSAPAAKRIHHAWRGGLLEHTLSVCGLVQAIWRHYEDLLPGLMDRDLLVAGAIVHDLGKVYEMDPITFEYTDEGRLLGHMSLMLMELERRIRARSDFPRSLALQLEHMLLSHHGELEYGSPKRPKTPEAWVLHYADILDGRMMWLSSLLEGLDPGQWSSYQKLYDRYFWKPPRENDSESEMRGRALRPEVPSVGDLGSGAGQRVEAKESDRKTPQTAKGRHRDGRDDGGIVGGKKEGNPEEAALVLLPGLERPKGPEDPGGG